MNNGIGKAPCSSPKVAPLLDFSELEQEYQKLIKTKKAQEQRTYQEFRERVLLSFDPRKLAKEDILKLFDDQDTERLEHQLASTGQVRPKTPPSKPKYDLQLSPAQKEHVLDAFFKELEKSQD